MTIAEDAKIRLLATAGPVFAEKGFEHATVREICQAADVNLAAINYYFGDKKTLYIETVREAHGQLVERVPMPDWPSDTPGPMKLRGFVRTLLTRMLSRDSEAWQPRLMLREILRPTEACRELIEDYFRPHLDFLASIIVEIVEQELPSHRVKQIAFSIIGQCLFYHVSGEIVGMILEQEELDAHFQTEQLAQHIVKFSLASLENLNSSADLQHSEEVLKS